MFGKYVGAVDTSTYIVAHRFGCIYYIGWAHVTVAKTSTTQHTYLKFKIIIHFASVDFTFLTVELCYCAV